MSNSGRVWMRAVTSLGVVFAVGCAHRSEAPKAQVRAAEAGAEVKALRTELGERDRRLNQLESRLALLEAEQRQHRLALETLSSAEPQPGIRETVRISAPPVEDKLAVGHEPSARREARPVLRLYEQSRHSSDEPLMSVPEVTERLPRFVPTLAEQSAPLGSEEHYRRALDLLRKREFDEALLSLNDFLVRYPHDPRAPRVMFWRGEVLFAQRDYARALSAFETSLAREPKGDKAADALLRVSRCYLRLGATERAADALERLKAQFPNSDAARLAAQEDA